MFISVLIAFIVFLIILFKKQNILLASITYVIILILSLLLNYKVLIATLLHFNYWQYLPIIYIIIFINIIYFIFNYYMKREIGYNITNLITMLFPDYNLRYISLLLISLLPLTPYFLINFVLLFLISRLAKLSRYFSTLIIFIGLSIHNLASTLADVSKTIPFNNMLLISCVIIAIIFILSLLSTNINQIQKFNFYKEGSKIAIILGSYILSFIFLSYQFNLNIVSIWSSIIAIAIIIFISNKKEYEYDSMPAIDNKYPYLLSISVILINISIILLNHILPFKEYNLLIQIGLLLIFNIFIIKKLSLPIINQEKRNQSNFLSIKKNTLLICAFISIIIIDILVSMSNFNEINLNQSIYNNITSVINNSSNIVELLVNTFSIKPFIINFDTINDLMIDERFIKTLKIFLSLISVTSPILLLAIYASINVKEKWLIQAYGYILLYIIICLSIIMMIISF